MCVGRDPSMYMAVEIVSTHASVTHHKQCSHYYHHETKRWYGIEENSEILVSS